MCLDAGSQSTVKFSDPMVWNRSSTKKERKKKKQNFKFRNHGLSLDNDDETV